MPTDATAAKTSTDAEKVSELSDAILQLNLDSSTQQSSVSQGYEPSTNATEISSVSNEDNIKQPYRCEDEQEENQQPDSVGAIPDNAEQSRQTNEKALSYSNDDGDKEEVVLYVTNLPYRVRWQELKDLFRWMIPADNVIRTEVFLRDDGRSSGTGIVKVIGRQTAARCVDVFDNYEWMSQNISVQIGAPLTLDQYAVSEHSSPVPSHISSSSSNRYIQQPPVFAPTSHHLQPVVGNPLLYGSIPYSGFIPSSSHSPSHYYAANSFIPYPSNASLQPRIPHGQARYFTLGEQQQHQQQSVGHPGFFRSTPLVGSDPNIIGGFGTAPEVNKSRNRIDRRKLFIGNVPYTTHWQELKDFLRTAGSIMRVDIVNSQDGRSKGFAVAVYGSDEDAENAINNLDGKEFEGRILAIRYDRYPDSALPGQIPLQQPPTSQHQHHQSIQDYSMGTMLGQQRGYDPLAAAKRATTASGNLPPDTFAMSSLPHSFMPSPNSAHPHYTLPPGYAYPQPMYISTTSNQPQSGTTVGLTPFYSENVDPSSSTGSYTYQQ